ncbi:hypothetical protein KUA08_02875 [Komagataeibacter melomenusus]|uniref:hypothetical protein n=1 Tax=Komagataeibacter melomenusus TaxID=2766578 RepID=UPI001C2DBA61|nr:hypothetical protein [Komagataeibacter melomenusus]MBV1829567.1 hypothetical protein [Komagataeibacter melomenusus]
MTFYIYDREITEDKLTENWPLLPLHPMLQVNMDFKRLMDIISYVAYVKEFVSNLHYAKMTDETYASEIIKMDEALKKGKSFEAFIYTSKAFSPIITYIHAIKRESRPFSPFPDTLEKIICMLILPDFIDHCYPETGESESVDKIKAYIDKIPESSPLIASDVVTCCVKTGNTIQRQLFRLGL